MICFFLIKVRSSKTFQLFEIPLLTDGSYNGRFCLCLRTDHIYERTIHVREIHVPSFHHHCLKNHFYVVIKAGT